MVTWLAPICILTYPKSVSRYIDRVCNVRRILLSDPPNSFSASAVTWLNLASKLLLDIADEIDEKA
jgi:hypothetical protein